MYLRHFINITDKVKYETKSHENISMLKLDYLNRPETLRFN